MRTKQTPFRQHPPAHVLALALMLLSVFAWGLQYKLSLYKVRDASHASVPAAKLLSPKERVSLPVPVLHPDAAVNLLLWVAAGIPWLYLLNRRTRPVPLFAISPAEQSAFSPKRYSRPPPPVLL